MKNSTFLNFHISSSVVARQFEICCSFHSRVTCEFYQATKLLHSTFIIFHVVCNSIFSSVFYNLNLKHTNFILRKSSFAVQSKITTQMRVTVSSFQLILLQKCITMPSSQNNFSHISSHILMDMNKIIKRANEVLSDFWRIVVYVAYVFLFLFDHPTRHLL